MHIRSWPKNGARHSIKDYLNDEQSTDDYFKMERAKGQPIYQCYLEGIEVEVLEALKELHETNTQAVTLKIVKRDLQIEVVDKTNDRKK